MSGTLEGGRKAAATNCKLYGKDFYANIGRMGGHKGRTGGFASDKVGEDGLTGRQRARIAGAKGGHLSKRGAKKYGKNFFSEIGKEGGSKGRADGAIKGFAAMTPEKRRAAGAKGGKISRRGPAKKDY